MTYSSKLSSHYLELAEQPISKDVFAGEDVRFSSEYEALENELGKALSLHENGQTDWLKILENSEALLRAQSGPACCSLVDLGPLPTGILSRFAGRTGIAGTSVQPALGRDPSAQGAHSRRGHCLAGAPAGAGAERERTDQEQLPCSGVSPSTWKNSIPR